MSEGGVYDAISKGEITGGEALEIILEALEEDFLTKRVEAA